MEEEEEEDGASINWVVGVRVRQVYRDFEGVLPWFGVQPGRRRACA